MPRPRLLLVLAVAAPAALVAVGAWGWQARRQADARERLPAPPEATTPAIAEHVGGAFAMAARQPTSIGAVGPLCLAYHADMLFGQAERCYDVAIELEPGNWRWVYYRAVLDGERGGGAAFVARLRRVVDAEPTYGPAWLRLGDAEFKAGRYEDAAAAWRRAEQLEDPPVARQSPSRAIEVPLSAYAGLGLARVALYTGDPAGAVKLLQPIVARVPGFGAPLRLLGDAYRALGQDAESARAVTRAARLPEFTPYADPMVDALARESRNSTLLLRLASEATLSANAEWTEFLTRRSLDFDPDNPEAVAKMGRILRAFGRDEEALPYFQRYHQLVPGDYQVLAQIGTCLSALGRYKEAESYFEQALRGVDDPVTHFNVGLLMARTGRLDGAVAAYQRALERDPRLSDARSNLATTFARQGRPDRAIAELQRVLADQPDNLLARTNLGLLRLQQGLSAEAAREFEAALRVDPAFEPAAEALRSLRGAPSPPFTNAFGFPRP